MGILGDKVSEVLDIHGADIEDAPSFSDDMDANFIMGMAKDSLKILLNIDAVLSGEEIIALSSVAPRLATGSEA